MYYFNVLPGKIEDRMEEKSMIFGQKIGWKNVMLK